MKTIASSGFESPILRRRYRQSSLTWSVCVQSPQRHRLAVGMRPTRNFTEFRGHRAQTTIGLPRRLALLTCMGSPYPLIRRSGVVCSDGAKLTVAAPRVVVEFWRRSAGPARWYDAQVRWKTTIGASVVPRATTTSSAMDTRMDGPPHDTSPTQR